ncbi:DMT family transporter [Rhizobium cremeum]|uniref:DMT family transporter n=1 Tax=Rhizobium cremeum TaxID=2813827 RepID=UPI001FD4CA68|nr:DMT family transporter [Rhizobium cremeum]
MAKFQQRESGSDNGLPMMPVVLALATVVIWSGNTIVSKAAIDVIHPASIAFYRWVIAFLVLAPFVLRSAWSERHVSLRYAPKLAFLGLMGMVAYQSLAYEAAKTTTAVNMGVLIALVPLISTFLAALIADERLAVTRIIGGIVSFAGLLYLTARGDISNLIEGGVHVGDGLMIVAVFSSALYGVLLKRWRIPISTWLQLWWQIGAAVLILLPFWLASEKSPLTAANLPLVLYAALPTSLLGPFMWMIAVRELGAARSSMFFNLFPVLVAALAMILLGERLESFHVIGGGLALLGVMIGLRQPAQLAAGT